MKPICVSCKRFYRPHKNGVFFVENMPIGNNVAPGISEPDRWKPYKLWQGDLWKCQGCGHELISGTGMNPVSEHYKPDFNRDVEAVDPQYQVNDC